MTETVTDRLNRLAAHCCDEATVKLVQRLDKHLNHNWDYVEK
jgi:hypothetical protein